MQKRERTRYRRWLPCTTRAATAVACIAAVTLTVPRVAYADPEPPPPAPAPADPGAPPPDPDPAPAPPPDPARVNVPAGGFSYDVPAGWTVGDASKISYGQAVLTKTPDPGAPPPTDTVILLGRLDLKLYAGAVPDNTKAAVRLASDMGEFYMPFQGTRINQNVIPLNAAGVPGAASYYEVKFNDTTKPNGQIWAAALGSVTPRHDNQPAQNNRWLVVWLGSANDPIDKDSAKTLAESIREYTPPPPDQPPADQNGPPPGDNNPPPPPPGGPPPVGVPVPVPSNPDMTPPP